MQCIFIRKMKRTLKKIIFYSKIILENKKEGIKVKEKSKKSKIIIAIIIVAIIVGILIFSNKKVKPVYDKNGEKVFLTKEQRASIYNDVKDKKGYFVKIKGKILSISEQDGIKAIQVIDHENNDEVACVLTDLKEKYTEEEPIEATGYITGTMEGTNAFGARISNPTIHATEIKKIEEKELKAPTTKEVTYSDKKITHLGYTIEIKKVEFSKEETRVFLEVENKGKAEINFFESNAKIIQGNTQYDHEYPKAEYKELNDEIKPGIKSDGVMTFKPIKEENFKLILKGYSNDYNEKLEDFEFELEVK